MLRRFVPFVALALVAGVLGAWSRPPTPIPAHRGSSRAKPYDQNFPDPSVFYDGATGRYYAFATTTGGSYVPGMASTDARDVDRPQRLPAAGLRRLAPTTRSSTTRSRVRRVVAGRASAAASARRSGLRAWPTSASAS